MHKNVFYGQLTYFFNIKLVCWDFSGKSTLRIVHSAVLINLKELSVHGFFSFSFLGIILSLSLFSLWSDENATVLAKLGAVDLLVKIITIFPKVCMHCMHFYCIIGHTL